MITIKNVQEPVSESMHWDFLEKCESYSYFQTPDWIRVLTTTYLNYKNATCLFQFSDNANILLPLIKVKKIKGLVSTYHSMPFNTYGGMIISDCIPAKSVQGQGFQIADWDEKNIQIIKHLESKRWIKFSITPEPLKESLKSKVQSPKLKCILMETQILRLEKGYKWIWENRFDSKNRNQIRKARKSGLTLAENIPDSGRLYYQLYRETIITRKGKGLVYPETLFIELAKSPEKAKYYFAFWNGKPVAGIIVLNGKGTAMYWSAVSLPEGKTLCANQLLLDHAIQNAAESGITIFDFGASKGLHAVKKFKSAFGGEEITYSIFEWNRYKRK